ncbi:RagB/SusD family nutrient uptake outer membrane protein [Flavicella sp.]|uniref:RagB/SusD family nutrient uptake outer membrane protein n=1 Tax=Flavicella sp. TaxID=2957742 RepID=UPI003015F186
MKKLIYIIVPCVMLLFTSCTDNFIDLTPPAEITEGVYFNETEHFLSSSNRFYTNLIGWGDQGVYSDHGSDLIGYEESSTMQDYSRGDYQPPVNDDYYSNAYEAIRDMNLLLERAETFEGGDISEYLAATKFHRAWQYFFLIQRFGGVVLVTSSLDVDSDKLDAPRNSRYEVVFQILADLDDAIAGLPTEATIASADKGKISKEAAKSFKADVLLHEATWMKYVGTTTDGDGVSAGTGSTGYDASNITAYLQEVVTLTKSVMDSGTFELWNHNDILDDLSSNFLFNLEDGGSNPGGLDKASNKEFIFYNKYDNIFRQANTLVSHVYQGRTKPSRKMIDLFLCTDGLTISQSSLFEGYTNTPDEYQNRDLRMKAYFTYHKNLGEIPQNGDVLLNGSNNNGYFNSKFMSWKWGTDEAYRATKEEAYDMPFIRLAEVYLMYAEALYELNGTLTDGEMNESINLVKARAGLPALTNAFLTTNNMDLKTEIRRERTIELYAEGSTRFTDLKRWGIAVEELGKTIYGAVIEGTIYEGNDALYTPSNYGYGEEATIIGDGTSKSCIVVQPSSIRNFSSHNYLFPLPTSQLGFNEKFLQNPGY